MSDRILPALFIGHGSPMNLPAHNSFTRDMEKLGRQLPLPEAIIVVADPTRGINHTAYAILKQIFSEQKIPVL